MKANILKAKAALHGIMTDKEVAEKIGMPQASYSRKIGGKTAFTIDEVKRLCKVLDLSDEDVMAVFFED